MQPTISSWTAEGRPEPTTRRQAFVAAALIGSVYGGLVGATLLCFLLTGCAPRDLSNPFAAGRAADDILLVVENQSPETMRIYVVMGGVPQNVGRVEGLSRARFRVGHVLAAAYDDLRIQAAPSGLHVETWTSDRLNVLRGEQIQVIVRNQLALSTFQVVPAVTGVRQ